MNSSAPVSEAVIQSNLKVLATLPFADTRDFENASRGLLARHGGGTITDDSGHVVWDFNRYDFLAGDAPASVNPSLWRQGLLNCQQGLFEVVEGIYQVRGFDIANITFIETDTGVVIMDPLTAAETARAAHALYTEHRGPRPVKAVIYTHSHADHFGGVKGVMTQEQADSGEVLVIAPEGFTEHAVAENVYAGTAMARRAAYMYGAALPASAVGQVGAGLNQTLATGSITLIAPTVLITTTGETVNVDGLEIEFQMAPGSEAPAEMHFYLPKYRALCMAENASHSLHNLLTLRGALVRDPRVWAQYISHAIELFGDRTDVEFGAHHWPTWGQEEIREFLTVQRDLYSYLHDQTLRMLNQGLTGIEIAEQIQLPPALENAWSARGYYGSVSHNVKAIYQRYMGWFDGNPAHLWQHVPTESATRYVSALGGADRTIELAHAAFAEGDFRWAATLLDHVVFADASNMAARELLAKTYDQLAFGIENATWRNFYLSGAAELRGENFGTPTIATSPDMIAQLEITQVFDAIAISVNGPQAWDLDLSMDWIFADQGRQFRTTLKNGVFVAIEKKDSSPAQVTITLAKPLLPLFLMGQIERATAAGAVIEGDASVLATLLGTLQPGNPAFAIVTPE
ncbi:alkyl/aryl-sulfatase [Aurantimicrobium minutum]|uniref:alkyl/aryl-sulfatase n=1 Tax=Aurantimicrobium minutum TaxID=708131 RepID=UPI002474A57C|nr:alkyl sulfatase dimerization domain-containing protein [Aurantimicrobium minutum]